MKTFEKKTKPASSPVRRSRTPVLPSFDPAAQIQRAQIRQVLRPLRLQAKLTIGQPNDKYEQEADRVADEVMRMPESRVQRQIKPEEEEEETLHTKPLAEQITSLVQRQVEPEEEEEEEEPIQTKQVSTQTPAVTPNLASRIQSLKGSGQPLPESVHNFFKPRFGYSFSGVQVHTDTPAAETARAVNARAFTVGRDILFGAGQFAPDSQMGKQLLAHELTHVIQQTPHLSRKSPEIQRQSAPDSGLPTPASPTPCVCPTTIRKDTILACDCPNGIVIAANDITLDCNGHTLTGSGRGTGVLLTRRTGVTVKNCKMMNFSMGVALRRSNKNTFTSNTANNCTRDGFDLNFSNRNTFTGNEVSNNQINGIELDDSNENNFNENIVKENEDGIDLNRSNGNAFTNNTANDNGRDGFRINRNSNSNTFTKNTANDNGRDGFRIDQNSDRNTFTGNTANNNSSDGFDLRSGRGNKCKNNTFTHPRCPEP